MSLAFRNAKIVLPDAVIDGTLALDAALISALDESPAAPTGAIDCEGDYLMPGLVELHTDNVEKHYQPRAQVFWDGISAAVAHDGQIATSGITTVYDSLCLGLSEKGELRARHVAPIIEGIAGARAAGMLRADHRIHLRCEVIGTDVLEQLAGYDDHPLVGLVSLMDHAPGQRQTADIEIWRRLRREVDGQSEAEIAEAYERLTAASRDHGPRQRRVIADWARTRGVSLASHDDETEAHVAESAEIGCSIAEFPTTKVAAEASRAHGLAVLMGGPNLVRGRSSYGNITARDLAAEGLLDIISSDYVPASMLHGAFSLVEHVDGWDLPRAIATVTATPARHTGLDDRGVIAPGKRADLIQVRVINGRPVVRGVWVEGKRVA
ncbi:MAG: alpha-D-ribose 1-methylphosphonate 5-triphosphate diphosphatase [Thalassobaculaceae bacterium]|nr:alpha-D-ribose 1-methylphosphonate 5-triphosphate diphosphatase [Thalassobaculaceae bacterium]